MIVKILAVAAGIVVGAVVNIGLIQLGHMVIPLPSGADVSSYQAVRESMHLFGPEQFIFPFLAHAGGTFAGALVAALIAKKAVFAYVIGVLFLLGGIVNAVLLPTPVWYDVIDLVFAYIPMAWIGSKPGTRR